MAGLGAAVERVAVIGESAAADRVLESIEATDRSASRVDPAALDEAAPDLVVAVGERAVIDLAEAGCRLPVLPVSAGPGLRSVETAVVAGALAAVEPASGSESAAVETHPVLTVSVDGRRVARALLDAVVATEPAEISAFGIRTEGERVDRVRADGVVLATPAGTPGYARSVGCPVIPPGSDCLAVAPIAPFTTDPTQWVLPVDDLTVRVTRDESDVELQVDGRAVAAVPPDGRVSLSLAAHLRTVRVPAGRSPFDGPASESEKL